MTKFIIRDKEAGNKIDEFGSYEEALEELHRYEAEDEKNGCFTPDFYEIISK